jgi:predicted Ser/Thr protein kinase
VEVGELFAGAYRIDAELARGGMGVVYRAMDMALERPVALKVMAATLSRDEAYRARFRREAAMAARIDHPHVVPVFHRGEHEGVMYVVMRLVDGIDLSEVLAREGRLDPARTSRLVTQVAGALDAAHQLGLVHRDVKPANIVLQGPERALLTDFGLAKQIEGGDALTSANTLLGTAAYLAPEQAQGLALDGSCDVYALACVTYQCLSGRTPYPEGPALTVAASHVYDPVPDLAAVVPDVPSDVVDVVRRGLAKSPTDRWPSAGAFAEALAAAVLPAASPAGPTVRLPGVPRPRRRRRTGVALVGGAVLVAGVAAALVALGGQGAPPGAPSPRPGTDRHAALARLLPVTVYRACTPAPAREKKGVVTAVDCRSSTPGADEVLVSQWQGPATMLADFDGHYGKRLPDGVCRSQSEVQSTWESGKLACYRNAGGATVLLYEYDKIGLQLLAVRKDGDRVQLYDWWHAIRLVPLRTP